MQLGMKREESGRNMYNFKKCQSYPCFDPRTWANVQFFYLQLV